MADVSKGNAAAHSLAAAATEGMNQSAWMHPRDQLATALLVLAGLAVIGGCWLSWGGWQGRLINVEQAARQPLAFQLDVNQAGWPELALLPGIGETLARRIVESREQKGAFRDPNDLLRVSGIGPKKLASLRPYLAPLPGRTARQDDLTR